MRVIDLVTNGFRVSLAETSGKESPWEVFHSFFFVEGFDVVVALRFFWEQSAVPLTFVDFQVSDDSLVLLFSFFWVTANPSQITDEQLRVVYDVDFPPQVFEERILEEFASKS